MGDRIEDDGILRISSIEKNEYLAVYDLNHKLLLKGIDQKKDRDINEKPSKNNTNIKGVMINSNSVGSDSDFIKEQANSEDSGCSSDNYKANSLNEVGGAYSLSSDTNNNNSKINIQSRLELQKPELPELELQKSELPELEPIKLNKPFASPKKSELTDNNNNKVFINRAIGNFIKGVLHLRFEGIVFKDYSSLIHFILKFDATRKISAQSLSNLKNRNIKYKFINITPEVKDFVNYVKQEFPEFKEE